MAKYLIRKCAAALAAFSLTVAVAALPSVDRHDGYLNERVQLQMQHKHEASQQYVNDAYEAMVKRNERGDYGEVLEP